MTIRALALFSGGLDSILSCRVMAAQGVEVQALQFVTPFFGYSLLARQEEHQQRIKEQFGIDVALCDVSIPYLRMLRAPAHGYGRNFNPCVDCKILLFSEARKMMAHFGASFLISGEVLGQRPMSQRQDTLRLIERDSGCADILLRPLCARNQPPTKMELDGLVDRERLHSFRGRSRTPQMELAREFGIVGYPSPAGGCILTDPILGRRIKYFFGGHTEVTANDMLLLQVGRQFELPGGGWLALGRRQEENDKILALKQHGDIVLKSHGRPGPTAILRCSGGSRTNPSRAIPDARDTSSIRSVDITTAAGIIARYIKGGKDTNAPLDVAITENDHSIILQISPLAEEMLTQWLR